MKEIILFRNSKYVKDLKNAEPIHSNSKEIENFAMSCSNMHSWYKHLSGIPGHRFYILQKLEKTPLECWNISYLPAVTKFSPSNKELITTWSYSKYENYDIKLENIKNNGSVNFKYIDRFLYVYLNSYFSPRSGSSRDPQFLSFTARSPKIYVEREGFKELLEKRKNEEELIRQIKDIIVTANCFVDLVYGIKNEFNDYCKYEIGSYQVLANFVESYQLFLPPYQKK